MEDSSLSRIVGALTSPAKTFAGIARKPTWLVVLVVVALLGVGVSYLMSARIDYEEVTRDAIAQGGRTLTEDQLQQAIDFQEKFGPIIAVVAPALFGPIMYLIAALAFLVALKLAGGELTFKQSFSTTLHGLLPWSVAGLLNIPVILGRTDIAYDDLKGGGNLLQSNLGFLAGEDTSAAVSGLLSSIDIFSIWSVVLLTIGYSIVAKLSRQSAGVVVGGLWVVWIVAKLAWTAIFS